MARGSVGRRGSRQLPTRKFVWARESFDLTVNALTVQIVNLLGDFQTLYGAQLIGSTVMRLRGRIEFEPNAASSTIMAAAVRVMNDQAAINVTGNDFGPFEDFHADWMAYEPLIFNDAAPGLDGQIHRWEIDVKSNRKLEELGDGLYLMIDNRMAATSLLAKGIVSVGLKLP